MIEIKIKMEKEETFPLESLYENEGVVNWESLQVLSRLIVPIVIPFWQFETNPIKLNCEFPIGFTWTANNEIWFEIVDGRWKQLFIEKVTLPIVLLQTKSL